MLRPGDQFCYIKIACVRRADMRTHIGMVHDRVNLRCVVGPREHQLTRRPDARMLIADAVPAMVEMKPLFGST